MKKTEVAVAAAALVGAMAMTTATALAGEPAGSRPAGNKPVVATFTIKGETFRVKFVEAADIERAKRVLAGEENPHPIGTIVYGTSDVNVGHNWHLSPVSWADFSTEVCDGLPSDVDNHAITSPYFCPWGAKLVSLE